MNVSKVQAEGSVRAITERVCDEIKHNNPQGTFNFISEFAHPIPAMILGSMLGVPTDMVGKFIGWSDQLAAFMQNFVVSESQDRKLIAATIAALDEMKSFFAEAISARRHKPQTDVLSDIAGASELSVEALRNQYIHLMFGGHKVPEFLSGSLLYLLARDPGLFEKVRVNRAILGNAVNEAIRFESPIQYITRMAIEPLNLRGQEISADSSVLLVLGSANRDERVFENPEQFDIFRAGNKHLGFGAGSHVCIGKPLVGMELTVMFDTLIEQFPNLRLLHPELPPAWSANPTFHGLRHLQVRFD